MDITRRLVAFRVYLIVQTVQVIDLAYNEPMSRAWSLRDEGGLTAVFATILMGALTLLVTIDLLLEIYGTRMAEYLTRAIGRHPRVLKWMRGASDDWPFLAVSAVYRYLADRRHLFWVLMALGYAIQTMVAVYHGYVPRLALLYAATAGACASVAWLDNKYRFEAMKEKLRASGYGDL